MMVIDLDQLREVLSTLRRNALRTALTAVGVGWGVFLLVMMVGMGNGLESGVKGSMSSFATNSIYIWGQRTSLPHAGLTPGRYVRLTLEDAEAMRSVAGVAEVAPRVSLGGRGGANMVSRGDKSDSFTVMGDTPAYLQVQPLEIDGRFINQLDMQRRRKVAVIGERVVKVLFKPDEVPTGQNIRIGAVDFLVVGVFKTTTTGERGARDAATVYTPLTTFSKVLTTRPGVDYVSVLGAPDVRAAAVQEQLLGMLRKRHRVAPADKQAFGSFNADAEYQKVVNLFIGISFLVYLVGSATLLAGLVGVSNIMMVSVRERTRELGIRKAIGATPGAVIGQVVFEAVVLASVAGYLGLVLGVALLEVIGGAMADAKSQSASLFGAPFVSLQTALFAALAVALGGGVAGLFPGLHAARLRTVDALRTE